MVFLEKPLYEICRVRRKEQVGENRMTDYTHMYAGCLLQNTSSKQNKYFVIQELNHVDIISFVKSECFVFVFVFVFITK